MKINFTNQPLNRWLLAGELQDVRRTRRLEAGGPSGAALANVFPACARNDGGHEPDSPCGE